MLMGLEDKPMMDEFVALYAGMIGGKQLEQKFRENIGVSRGCRVDKWCSCREDRMRARII